MDRPTDGQKEIWVRQQPSLVKDVLESRSDVIHDFNAFWIISAHASQKYQELRDALKTN